ncbi:glycosyltransferase [Cyanobacterium aponinum AL20118]|uniref:Glycosyltransferase n=1 Tax=Cyanobacterium aponinum AL20115 TaxID=3090662 RepID=A0AAF1C4I6_9CHRO|nr:glycosyltransferase [Cyanobacterium aponinum]WPF87266.1 glycosyltransferase [Cyanobacterium aponinum AL20115]
MNDFLYLAPTVGVFVFGIIILQFFDKKSPLGRGILVSVFFLLTVRYLLWRGFYTLNLATKLTTAISLFIFILEFITLIVPHFELFLGIKRNYRHQEADFWEATVKENQYSPTVDIFIPTYNESIAILRRTIIGCQAIEYPHKKVYLLDDGNRKEVEELAFQLGCNYIAREEHQHAKAGNLNHALKLTNGDLVTVFDADFVPCKNFLTRTVGFFQKPELGLLQTHQHYYNQDTVARNLGLENILGHPTEECSSRLNQPMRDYYNSVMCYGSSFIVRRSALNEVNGFYTDSVAEDYFTTILLLGKKYEVIYLTERLSAGLVPENIPALFRQRMRWAQGTMEGFFVSANPLTIKGLNFHQRIIYLTGVIHWFTSISILISLVIFPLCFIFKMPPLVTNVHDWLSYFLPLMVFQFTIFYRICDNSTAKIVADIYSLILAFPVSLAIIKTLVKPFSGGFKVTPKGICTDKAIFRWNLALPLIYAFISTLSSLIICIYLLFNSESVNSLIVELRFAYSSLEIGIFWNLYYLILLTVAILAFVEKPQKDFYPWLNINTSINIKINNNIQLYGFSYSLSEKGVKISFPDNYSLPLIKHDSTVELHFNELNLTLNGIVKDVNFRSIKVDLLIEYPQLNLSEYRTLVEFLFCSPHRWQTKIVPNEIQSILILLNVVKNKILLFPFQKKQNKLGRYKHLSIKAELDIINY